MLSTNEMPGLQTLLHFRAKAAGIDQGTKELAGRLYMEGTSFRVIGQLLSVHYVSVINWVNPVWLSRRQ
jgi:transposase-like protein